MRKVILSADSTCDLDDRLKKKYNVYTCPLHVILGKEDYLDGVNITPDNIYNIYEKHHILPKTAAPNPLEYISFFKKWTDEGYDVIHLNISSELSSSYQNCCTAAEYLKNVYPINSNNLSTGIGLLVIEAAERIAEGMPANQIYEEINRLKLKCHTSFVVDSLRYLYEGGRCSALKAMGANILNIKPCIEVDNSRGIMNVGKKYRGTLDKVLRSYTVDKLKYQNDLKLDRIFITHSGISPEVIKIVKTTVEDLAGFKEILITRAGCTISSHCGPNTVGILFMTK